MTRRFALTAALALLLSATTDARQGQTYGTGVSLSERTAVSQVLDTPGAFEGKTVRVDGTVTAVCTHEGCWMSFAADRAGDGRTLLIKVDDGVIVFPVSARGKKASAQGVIERIGGGEAQEAAGEHAKQTASAPARWQLKATGAVVY